MLSYLFMSSAAANSYFTNPLVPEVANGPESGSIKAAFIVSAMAEMVLINVVKVVTLKFSKSNASFVLLVLRF